MRLFPPRGFVTLDAMSEAERNIRASSLELGLIGKHQKAQPRTSHHARRNQQPLRRQHTTGVNGSSQDEERTDRSDKLWCQT